MGGCVCDQGVIAVLRKACAPLADFCATDASPLNLVAQDSVFGHQILISGQQLLVNGSRDVSKHSLPVHRLKLNASTRVQTTFRPRRKCLRMDSFGRFDHTSK